MPKDVVLITGSGGYIGSTLMRHLAARYTVVGLDRPEFDLTSDASVQAALDAVRAEHGPRIASVIHLAAYYSFDGDPDPRYHTVNVAGTERLLRALQAFEVGQFVYASTMLVHAPTEPGRPIDERSPLAPAWDYPRSKRAAEQCIAQAHGRIPTVIVRLAGVYNDSGGLPALTQQIQRIRERRLIARVFPGDTSHGQSALHLDDLLDLFARVVDRRDALPPEATFLGGEPEAMSYADLQRALGELLHGEPAAVTEIPKLVAKSGAWLQEVALPEDLEPFIKHWMIDIADDHYELDVSHARELLGWTPQHRLRDTLPGIVAELQRDPRAWYEKNKLTYHEGPPERRHLVAMHRQKLWPHYLNLALGAWLVTSPFAFGYMSEFVPDANVLRVMEARGLAPFEWRNFAMTVSDVVSGVLVMLFSILSADPRRRFAWSQWANAAVGLWLLFAPLFFWTPLPEAYANGTLVGALVIAFAVLVPTMPGMSVRGMTGGPDIPPGWTNCPSTIVQRLPIVGLALFGVLFSRYLTAYQLGHIDHPWDPFFGAGTRDIITSDLSHAWPWADAGIGTVAYVTEVLMGVMGTKQRWRTMPWMVLGFGVLIVPLGGVSIFFIIIQPIAIGTWCTLCLLGALAMVVMIPYSLDELVATGQFLVDAKRRGKPLWRVFWLGDRMDGGSADRSPGLAGGITAMAREMGEGVTLPWTLLASAAIGVWLMFTRLTFDNAAPLADSDHLVGALVFTVAVSALAEVGRPLRFINVAFGAWLIAAPFVLDGAGGSLSVVNGVACGLLLIGLSLPRGPLRQRYGPWQRFIV